MNKNFMAGFSLLLLSILACEPVFAIGWRELFVIFAIIAFLLGPPIYRFIRTVENFLRRDRKDK